MANNDLRSMVARYLEHIRARGYAPVTERLARATLRWLSDDLQQAGVTGVAAITPAHLFAFTRRIDQELSGRAAATRRVHVARVRSFFRYLVRAGLVLLDPAADLRLPVVRRLPRNVPSVRQVERLLALSDTSAQGLRDQAILELLYGTGIRIQECVHVDLSDISGDVLHVRQGKGRKDRVVPIPYRALLAIERYLGHSRPILQRRGASMALFLGRGGRRLGDVRIRRIVADYGRKASLVLTPHALRHACATHLLRGGADVRHVQQLLGHADIQTTTLYTRVDGADLEEMIARAHPRERPAKRVK